MTTKATQIECLRSMIRTLRADSRKLTIAAIVSAWNAQVKHSGFLGVYDFPTTGYTRKAQIMADFDRVDDQLRTMAIVESDAVREADLAAARPVCEETGIDSREWSGDSIEADHTAALLEDAIKHPLPPAVLEVIKLAPGADACSVALRLQDNGGNIELVAIAMRNMQETCMYGVNPLGYHLGWDGVIRKILYIEEMEDGSAYINCVGDFSDYYNEDESVKWFMPDAAPDFEATDTSQFHDNCACLIMNLITHGIDPDDFTASVAFLNDVSLRYFVKMYVDFVSDATSAQVLAWRDVLYILKEGETYDKYTALAKRRAAREHIRSIAAIDKASYSALELGVLAHTAAQQILFTPPAGYKLPDFKDELVDVGGITEAAPLFLQALGRSLRIDPAHPGGDTSSFIHRESNGKLWEFETISHHFTLPKGQVFKWYGEGNKLPRGKCAQRMLSLGWSPKS